jgi:5-methylcytosine-specific restriction endonuclease McrA
MKRQDPEYRKIYYKEHKEEETVRNASYREKHLKKSLSDARKHNRKVKQEVFSAYSEGEKPHCVVCGIDDLDLLCIDHVFMGGNEHRRQIGIGSGTNFYEWLRKSDFPSGFQILCFNCNHKKEVVRQRALYQEE